MNLFKKEEKKVEYLELIYDLIFVYMVGRNNALIHNIQNGFVEPKFFIGYVLCTLAIIQIWNFSTLYINMFGRNSIRDHVFLFINMYLLYFVGQSTGSDWQAFQTQYYIAWGLILLNIGIQFLIELRNHRMTEWNKKFIKRMSTVLFVEAGLVFIAAFLSPIPGAWVTAAAILSGILLTTVFSKQKFIGGWIDFAHLTERAMLYVVLTLLVPALSFGPIQCRFSEALVLLCFWRPDITIGLTIGCLISNGIGAALGVNFAIDMVFGTLATLLSCLLISFFSKRLFIAWIWPVLFNAVIVGTELYLLGVMGDLTLWQNILYVGIGETIAMAAGYALWVILAHMKFFNTVFHPTRHREVKW